MNKHIFIPILIWLTVSQVFGQTTELFKGESLLNSCKVEIPLTYKKADDVLCEKMGKELRDTELVLLSFNKKTRKASYSFYYIVVDKVKGETFVYLETPEDHNSNSTKKQAIFASFNKKTDRFYRAECFKKILEENTELSEFIKKE